MTALVVACGPFAVPTHAQSLAERIAQVRQKRAEEAAKAQKASVSPRLKMLQALVYGKVTAKFEQTPARAAFEYLQTVLGVNMIVRYRDDQIGFGIDPDQPITLTAEEMNALDLLNLMLEQCSSVEDCTWQLRESFIEIGTKERLAAPPARFVKAYPIDDLLYQAPRFDDSPRVGIVYWDSQFPGDPYGGGFGGGYPGGYGGTGVSGSISVGLGTPPAPNNSQAAQDIIDLILDTVEPTAWMQNGGSWSSIRYHEGALIVYGPEFIHRQIGGYGRIPAPGRTSATPSTAPSP
jgi:hypothetical protein